MTVTLRQPRDDEYDGWLAAEIAGYEDEMVEEKVKEWLRDSSKRRFPFGRGRWLPYLIRR